MNKKTRVAPFMDSDFKTFNEYMRKEDDSLTASMEIISK
jgi:hypothetical protein